LSGQGNQNNLAIEQKEYEEILTSIGENEITYEPGFGSFDVYIEDESKIDLNNNYQLKIVGPTESTNKTCNFFNNQTFIELIDKNSGIVYTSASPISEVNKKSMDELGFKIILKQQEEPGNISNKDNGFLKQTLTYKDSSKPQWFNAIKNIKNNELKFKETVLDPYEDFYDLSANNGQSLYFYPLIDSKGENTNLSTLSSLISPIMKDKIIGIKYGDLNNVDIMMTPDKTKWSRCIVTETAQHSFTDLGLSTIDDLKMHEVRTTPSIGKDGKPDNSGTSGFSWFPGYAIDVETGKRVNIFFGENSVYREYSQSNATDMIFNPSAEITNELIPNEINLVKTIAGGQHYIYVTRQDYDGCNQLSTKLKKGISTFAQRVPIGSITWTCIPILNEGANLLSMEDGLIPNEVLIKLRTTNPFNHERNLKDLDIFKNCSYDPEPPTYQFKFVKKENTSIAEDINYLNHWTFTHSFNGFSIKNIDDAINVTITDVEGKLISTHAIQKGIDMNWEASKHGITNKMVFVKVQSKVTGSTRGYKVVVLNQ
jgi:hypothetical protein